MSAFALVNFEPVKLTIEPAAELAKSQALEGAKAIVEITDAVSQQAAVDAIARCKRFSKRLEDSRKDVKAPVIKLGKDIDGMAATFGAEVLAEETRLDNMVKKYFREEAEKAARAQRMRDDIAAKKKKREQEIADQAEAERKRLEAEAQKTEDPEQAAELARKAQDAALVAEDATQRAENVSASLVTTPARSDGMTVRKVWKHRIIDIHALYAARPDLVSLEPKTNAINTAIRQGGDRKIPGLEIYEEIDTSVRS